MSSHITKSIVINFPFQFSLAVRPNQPQLTDQPGLLVPLMADTVLSLWTFVFLQNQLTLPLVTPRKSTQF